MDEPVNESLCNWSQDLAKAREGFVLTSDLHLTYLVTPVNIHVWKTREVDWKVFYNLHQSLKVSLMSYTSYADKTLGTSFTLLAYKGFTKETFT